MEASFIEIYNETLRDLLSTGQKDMKHEIRMDSKKQGMVYVTNFTPVVISSQQQVHTLYMYIVLSMDTFLANDGTHTCIYVHVHVHTYMYIVE